MGWKKKKKKKVVRTKKKEKKVYSCDKKEKKVLVPRIYKRKNLQHDVHDSTSGHRRRSPTGLDGGPIVLLPCGSSSSSSRGGGKHGYRGEKEGRRRAYCIPGT